MIQLPADRSRTAPRLSHHPLTLLALIVAGALFSAQAAAECAEVGYVAKFKVKPGSEAAFEDAITTLAETVRRVESGVLLYAPYKGADNTYYMMERYENEAARAEHATTDEVRGLFPALMAHVEGSPDVQPVSAVCR